MPAEEIVVVRDIRAAPERALGRLADVGQMVVDFLPFGAQLGVFAQDGGGLDEDSQRRLEHGRHGRIVAREGEDFRRHGVVQVVHSILALLHDAEMEDDELTQQGIDVFAEQLDITRVFPG